MTRAQKTLFTGTEWSPEMLDNVARESARIAEEELRLDYYPFQIEIITNEQFADILAAVGLPMMYRHWSFGKRVAERLAVHRRFGNPVYEMVINSDPCIVYCMERNTMAMQAMVIAHAAFGHNAFFKNNYLFRQWTRASAIVDYTEYAQNFIAQCEEKYGVDEVEHVLDACHALFDYGVDRYKRPPEKTWREREERERERAEAEECSLHPLWPVLPRTQHRERGEETVTQLPREPDENLLYFIEKHAPELPQWKREIVRIVRKISQYFYPQALTKGMNEGFAVFVHYYIMNRLYEKGLITDGSYQEFLAMHTNLIKQPDFDERVREIDPKTGKETGRERFIYSGLNPYALWFAIFTDIKRMCEAPTAEDREWFPDIAGGDWVAVLNHAAANFKDESGIRQFLSPKVMRDWRLFSVVDDGDEYVVMAIHDDDGYKRVRNTLASLYERAAMIPDIEITDVDWHGNRTLTLEHTPWHGRALQEEDSSKVVKYFASLWGFPVMLKTIDEDGDFLLIDSTKDDEDGDEDDNG